MRPEITILKTVLGLTFKAIGLEGNPFVYSYDTWDELLEDNQKLIATADVIKVSQL